MNAIFLLLFLLLSCSKQSHWAFDQVHSDQKEFRSAKLTYYSLDPVHGIDLEFLKTEEHLKVYLNIHSIPIAPNKEDPKNTVCTIVIDEETLRCSAYRLDGGQRFLISNDVGETLIEALKNQKPVSISIASYRTVLKPEDFSSKFEKLLNPLPIQNPFHLPF